MLDNAIFGRDRHKHSSQPVADTVTSVFSKAAFTHT